MPDFIDITDLHMRTIIGINPDERVNKQDVYVNVTLETDCRPAAASDDINDAVNYRDLCKDIIDLVEGSSFLLVERLAEEIAKICLADERVQWVRVKVDKPGALRFAQSVGVTIERCRDDFHAQWSS
ncbi:MAG: dihydroneopterin aldolase [Planctomycetaceae bacterium]|nr:dihydroneopterin aldolase [Planctomycetaceae bacterium]